ncbi:MAG: sulfite exporter TauE/SafE family protein [Pseudomonadota bacterium]
MTLESYLVAAFAVVLTGISKSGFAGGLGVLGVPLVAMTMPPQGAAVLLLPILVGIDLLSIWQYRRAWRASTVLALLPGAAFGIGIGIAGFAHLNEDALRLGIGLLALLFVARFAWAPPVDAGSERASAPTVFAMSALSGFAGFLAHAGGPPIKGTFLRLGLEKSAFVGTNAVFFCILNLAKAAGYMALGLFSAEGLLASASLIPFLLLGVGSGFALHSRIPQAQFTRLAYALLALAGTSLVMTGLVGLFDSQRRGPFGVLSSAHTEEIAAACPIRGPELHSFLAVPECGVFESLFGTAQTRHARRMPAFLAALSRCSA